MKQKHIFQGVFGTLAGLVLACSCSSEEMDGNGNQSKASSFIMIGETNEQSVKLQIDYQVVEGYRVLFDVYAENPYEVTSDGFSKKDGVKPIMSGMTDEKGCYDITRILPGGVKEVYVTSDCVGVPVLLHGTITSGSVTPVEVDLAALENSNADNPHVRSVDFPVCYLGDWNYWGRPDYIDYQKSYTLSKMELKSITSELPEWRAVNKEFCTAKGFHVEKEAEIWISLISDKSLFNNALEYYCYQDGTSQTDITEVIALPRTDLCSLLKNGLKHGEYVKLKYYNPADGKLYDKFPAGTNVGWVLHRSGYHLLTSTVGKGTYQFYSNSAWNPERTQKNHTAIFKTSEGNLIIGFEDTWNDGILGGDNDCNDIILHVASEPQDAIAATVQIPSDETRDEVEEQVDVVQPLSGIVDVPGDMEDDFYVASKSTLTVIDGSVMGIKDVLYIANYATMNDMVSYTYDNEGFERKVVVRTTVKFARAAGKGRTVVRTTVKNTSWDVETKSRTVLNCKNVDELILNSVRDHLDDLQAGKIIKIEITMEFEDGVSYPYFINSISLPPYSPFIEDTGTME